MILMLMLLVQPFSLVAQEATPQPEQQLEALAATAGVEALDENQLLLLEQFRQSPLNLNKATEADLQELLLLTPLQIRQLISYRQWFGQLVHRYELQAVPGWHPALIQALLPYITVEPVLQIGEEITNRFKKGEHQLLLRVSRDLPGHNPGYAGSPERVLLRYRYQYKNLLQYGWLAEKDAGEEWFSGSQPRGFDFYSAHFFARNLGKCKALALGDFTVNMGQGLLIWQNLAFRKGGEVMMIRRQSPVFKPYHAAGEANFHRGIGITVGAGRWALSGFASWRRLDGNQALDSVTGTPYISSLLSTGLHRTPGELADRNTQAQFTLGAVAAYQHQALHVGLNALAYRYALPFRKTTELYQLYALRGGSTQLASLDLHYTYKNVHGFAECAVTQSGYPALLAGMLMSLSASVDLSLLFRKLHPGYTAPQANAFTESTLPVNEQGCYAGISIRPGASWKLDAYADHYFFPWLRYRLPAPARGRDYMLQLQFKRGKYLEMTARYRSETKDEQAAPLETDRFRTVMPATRSQFRWELEYKMQPAWLFRCRADLIHFKAFGHSLQQGWLLFGDCQYKPPAAGWSLSFRLQVFESDSYDTRLYAYEQDVQYSFSIPAFYNRGWRFYLLGKYRLRKNLTCWMRLAQTRYSGSSQEPEPLPSPLEATFQLQFRF